MVSSEFTSHCNTGFQPVLAVFGDRKISNSRQLECEEFHARVETRVTVGDYSSFFRRSFSLRASSACSRRRAQARTSLAMMVLSSPLLAEAVSVRPIRAARLAFVE